MKLIATPPRLYGVILLILTVFVLGGLHVVVMELRPWWQLQLFQVILGAGFATLVVAPQLGMVLRGRMIYRWTLMATASFWILESFVRARQTETIWAAFYAFGALTFWIVALIWFWKETDCCYLNPKLKWYEGAPQAIPGLECSLEIKSKSVPAFPIDLDERGLFAFLKSTDLESAALSKQSIKKLTLSFQGSVVECAVALVSVVDRAPKTGLGLRLCGNSRDQLKEFFDLLEKLRTKGYAA